MEGTKLDVFDMNHQGVLSSRILDHFNSLSRIGSRNLRQVLRKMDTGTNLSNTSSAPRSLGILTNPPMPRSFSEIPPSSFRQGKHRAPFPRSARASATVFRPFLIKTCFLGRYLDFLHWVVAVR